MSFQTTYYFSLLENEFQQLKISQDIAEKEILARNIISRGYYTVLLHCKYVLNEVADHRKETKSIFTMISSSK